MITLNNTNRISNSKINKCLEIFKKYQTITKYEIFYLKKDVLQYFNSNEIKQILDIDTCNILFEKFSNLDFEFIYFPNFSNCLYLLLNIENLIISFDESRNHLILNNKFITIEFIGSDFIEFTSDVILFNKTYRNFYYGYSIDRKNICISLSQIIKKLNIELGYIKNRKSELIIYSISKNNKRLKNIIEFNKFPSELEINQTIQIISDMFSAIYTFINYDIIIHQ